MLFIFLLCILFYINIYFLYLILKKFNEIIIYKIKIKILDISVKYENIENEGLLNNYPIIKHDLDTIIRNINKLIYVEKIYKIKINNNMKNNNHSVEKVYELNTIYANEEKQIIELLDDMNTFYLTILKSRYPLKYIFYAKKNMWFKILAITKKVTEKKESNTKSHEYLYIKINNFYEA